MKKFFDIEYLDIEQNIEYETIIEKVLKECFQTEGLENSKIYVSITLTTPENIKRLNKQYRNIDSETDVLSFPMFEKSEIDNLKNQQFEDTLGDIVISIERVKEQAVEYQHSFEREFAYMIVHGFYHLMGEDHINTQDKIVMREKEENILNKLNIVRE